MAETGIPEQHSQDHLELKCEHASNPIGLDEPLPRFSWICRAPGRNRRQTAYRIRVSTDPSHLTAPATSVVWDSGKVVSDRTHLIAYSGPKLESCTRYYWAVQSWNEDDRLEPWSAPAFFETAFLEPDEWTAPWVQGRLFRKEFRITGAVHSARLYIAGIGWHEARLNGRKIGARELEPAQTDYDARVQYTTHDVTEFVASGDNCLGVLVGRGRFAVLARDGGVLPFARYAEEPMLSARLCVRTLDGLVTWIETDTSWQIGESPIVSDDIYDGETYDARLEVPRWDEPGCAAGRWSGATLAKAPKGRLVANGAFPAIRQVGDLPATGLREVAPSVYVFDFGQVVTGWVRLGVQGPRGAKVTMRFSELTDEDGRLHTLTNRNAKATETYILKGGQPETYQPRFTYHSFRYVEVAGFPGVPSLEALRACVVRSDVRRVGNFSCSNSLIERIDRAIHWSLSGNLMSVPTDCASRDERMGWLGDAHLVAEVNAYNYDMAAFYTKFCGDLQDSQLASGDVPDAVPRYWQVYPTDPAWGAACIIIPWTIYQFYDDQRILERTYPMAKAYVRFCLDQMQDGIFPAGRYGDWVPPSSIPSNEVPANMVSTWYCHVAATLTARMARLLGREHEARQLDDEIAVIASAYNRRYLNLDWYSGFTKRDVEENFAPTATHNATAELLKARARSMAWLFFPPTQTAQALPIVADMVPEAAKKRIARAIVYNVQDLRGGHIGCGIVGTRHILDALTKIGRADLAYRMLTRTTYPGWGYMLREGATTLWERWEYLDGDSMNTHNHAMFGTVGAWFYKTLAGIHLCEDAPGFRRSQIKPHIVGDLKWASGSIDTVYGRLLSTWALEGAGLLLCVEIPNNCRSTVMVPKRSAGKITLREGDRLVWDGEAAVPGADDLGPIRDVGDAIAVEVGSGRYEFISTAAPETAQN